MTEFARRTAIHRPRKISCLHCLGNNVSMGNLKQKGIIGWRDRYRQEISVKALRGLVLTVHVTTERGKVARSPSSPSSHATLESTPPIVRPCDHATLPERR